MMLHEFLISKLLPLFCDVDTTILTVNNFTLSGLDIFNFFYFIVLSFAIVYITVYLPFKLFKWLMHGCKKGGKRK